MSPNEFINWDIARAETCEMMDPDPVVEDVPVSWEEEQEEQGENGEVAPIHEPWPAGDAPVAPEWSVPGATGNHRHLGFLRVRV